MESAKLDWQVDWNAFVKVLGEQLQRRAPPEEIASFFGSRSITWTGVLTDKSLEGLAPEVAITLPKAEIQIRAQSDQIDELSVPVAQDAILNWKAIPIGAQLSFTAVLGGGPVFPPVEVKTLKSGRAIVMIRVHDGRPLLHDRRTLIGAVSLDEVGCTREIRDSDRWT